MRVDVEFPGGLRVDACIGRHRIATDQSQAQGGEGSAPSPLAHFYASLATCAGFYALRFCRTRDLSTEGLGVTLETAHGAEGRLAGVSIRIALPVGFPDRYREAIRRAAEQCAVHQFILEPVPIEIAVEPTAAVAPTDPS